MSVPATHTRVTLHFRGATTGSNPVDYWVADNGLILKQQESVTVRQPIGPLGGSPTTRPSPSPSPLSTPTR